MKGEERSKKFLKKGHEKQVVKNIKHDRILDKKRQLKANHLWLNRLEKKQKAKAKAKTELIRKKIHPKKSLIRFVLKRGTNGEMK